MGTRTGHRKSGLMDRLRRLRSMSSLQVDTTGHASDNPPPYTAQNFMGGKIGNGWLSGSKPRSKQRDQTLDLEKLDSKLEQWARERRLEEESEEVEDAFEDNDEALATKSKADEPAIDASAGDGADKQPDPVLEAAQRPDDVSIPPPQREDTEDPVIHQSTDPEPEPDTQPSDFDLFLQKSAEEERLRQEKGDSGRTPKPRREPALNHFYVNNWADRDALPSKPKLTEIRETEDPTDQQQEGNHPTAEHVEPAAAADSGSSAVSTATASSTASSGSHDFADPTSLQYTATTQTASSQPRVGRHVSFTEPPTTIIPSTIRERSASYPVVASHGRHAQVRFESPRGGRRRRQGAPGQGRKKGIGRIFAGFGR